MILDRYAKGPTIGLRLHGFDPTFARGLRVRQ